MSESNQYKTILSQGLWGNNIVLKQSLALCPLLAVTSSATNGLGLGLATMVVMVAANTLNSMAKASSVRRFVFRSTSSLLLH